MTTATPTLGSDETISDATIHNVDDLRDGDVVVGGAEAMPFVIEEGERRPVESVEAFFSAGYQADQVKVVADPRLEMMPLGPPVIAKSLTGVRGFDSQNVFLGSGHYMRTWGTLDLGTGQIAARTRIYTITWFGGYHGASYVIFADANDAPVHQSQTRRYGVDGTAVGTSDLTQAWWESMSPQDAERVRKIYVFHTWAPDNFQTVLNKWVAAGQSIAQLAGSVAQVAKVVAVFI